MTTNPSRPILPLLLWLPALVWGCAGNDQHSDHVHAQGEHEDARHDDALHEHDSDERDDRIVHLEPGEIEEFGVTIAESGPGELHRQVVLPGEITVNPDSLVHITPRVPGVARAVFKKLGDDVAAGELLAVLDSRELAEAKAAYLAAGERLELAGSNLQREQYLHEREISSEQEYLEARQAEAEARIAITSAEQHLHALGLDEEEVRRLKDEPDENLTKYEMRAPSDGTVVEKHVTLGEMLREDSLPFVTADLSTVWAVLTVYQKDLAAIRPGQAVEVVASHELAAAAGVIDYVSPILDEHTRTTTARVVLTNDERRWRPGLFVTGVVVVERLQCDVVVPKTAVQILDGSSVVFVATGDGFEARPVRTGQGDDGSVEIVAGLGTGERYAAEGGFALKAELIKATFSHAGHGH